MAASYEMSLQDYVRILFKRKWIILLSTFTVGIVAVVYTNLLRPRYRASGEAELQFRVDYVNMLSDLFFQGSEIASAQQLITSNEVLGRAAEALGLVDPTAPDPYAERLRAAMALKSGLSVELLKNTTIFRVTYTGEDPEAAARRVNAVLKAFQEVYAARSQEGQKGVLRFLESEIERLQEELAEKEAALARLTDNPIKARAKTLAEQGAQARAELEEIALRLREVRDERAALEEAVAEGHGDAAERYVQNHPDVRALREEIVEKQMTLEERLRVYTPQHPEVRAAETELRGLYLRMSETIRRLIEERREALASQEEALLERMRRLRDVVSKADASINALPVAEIEVARLERDIRALERVFGFFQEEYQKKRMEARLDYGSEIKILSPASAPGAPFYPSKKTNVSLGVSIGFLLGLALAFIVESLDTSIATIEDVERYTELPVLGVIPHIHAGEEEEAAPPVRTLDPGSTDLKEARAQLEEALRRAEAGGPGRRFLPQLITYLDPKDPAAEAFRTLRTNLQFKAFGRGIKSLCVTSSGPQEGKTTTLANLAVVLAQSGFKVLAVSSNLRRPAVHKFFGLPKKPGLVDVLIGARKWDEVVHPLPIENLSVLASGPIPPNPAELLASEEMTGLISEFEGAYDVVLFDCPPVLPVTDAAILGAKTGGILLVYYIGRAAREALLRAKVQLENVGTDILGIALNQVHPEGKLGYSYYYYHYHYYGEPTELGRRRR